MTQKKTPKPMPPRQWAKMCETSIKNLYRGLQKLSPGTTYYERSGYLSMLDHICDELLSLRKIWWRHKLGNPEEPFRHLMAVARDAGPLVDTFSEAELIRQPFAFSSAAFIYYLVDEEIPVMKPTYGKRTSSR